MKKAFLAVLLAVCVMLCGCESSREYTESFYAMDTFMTLTAYGKTAEQGAKAVSARITELDRLWSVTDKDSEIYAVNHGKASAVSPETADLVSFALQISAQTDGALDPTVYPILTAWGFTTGENRVPSEDELSRLLENIGYENVSVTENEIQLPADMMLDLGAVAKGRASDLAAEILRENGVESAIINLGGNIYALGSKPDGSAWKIGVQSPIDDSLVGSVSLTDSAAVTSGKYHRYFTAPDGTVYGHIIDPATGYPADNSLLSVTVIAPSGTLCDALSTALFVMGKETAERFWEARGGFDMILITSGEIIVTSGIAERFSLSDDSFTLTVLRQS